jgi:hypothetical protein
MSVCRGARDLTFQYPCSCRFPLPAGGTEPLGFPSRRGENLQARGTAHGFGSPREAGGT